MKNASIDEKALYLHALWDHILFPEVDKLFQPPLTPSDTKVRGILEHMRRTKTTEEIFGTQNSKHDSFCALVEDRINLETKRVAANKGEGTTEADLVFYQEIKEHLAGKPPLSAKRFAHKIVKHHGLDSQQKEAIQLFFAKAWTENLCYRFLAAKVLKKQRKSQEDGHAAR